MNYSPTSSSRRDQREVIQRTGSVLHEDSSETSGGNHVAADDEVSPKTPLILSPCCIIDSFKESCHSDHVILKIRKLIMVRLCGKLPDLLPHPLPQASAVMYSMRFRE